jgi:hypothetical protein
MARRQQQQPPQVRDNLVQLHTTGSISPPPLVPLPGISTAYIIPAIGLIAISAFCAAIGTWILVDGWYGGPAQRELQLKAEAVNSAAIAINDRLNQAKGAICQ